MYWEAKGHTEQKLDCGKFFIDFEGGLNLVLADGKVLSFNDTRDDQCYPFIRRDLISYRDVDQTKIVRILEQGEEVTLFSM